MRDPCGEPGKPCETDHEYPTAEENMNKEKSAFFDTQADQDWADEDYTPEEKAKLGHLIQITSIKAGTVILEPGCGTGRLTKILSDTVGRGGRVVALDISPKMIAKCRRRVENAGNVGVYFGAVEDFPFEERSFDVVFCHQVFPHFDDKLLALTHLVRALKPGGTFIVFHFENSARINDMHRKSHPAVLSDIIPTPEDMKGLFAAVGMQIVTLQDSDQGYLLIADFPHHD